MYSIICSLCTLYPSLCISLSTSNVSFHVVCYSILFPFSTSSHSVRIPMIYSAPALPSFAFSHSSHTSCVSPSYPGGRNSQMQSLLPAVPRNGKEARGNDPVCAQLWHHAGARHGQPGGVRWPQQWRGYNQMPVVLVEYEIICCPGAAAIYYSPRYYCSNS